MEFEGKTVLVTGSSRHTGLGIAKTFLKAGAQVGINSGNPENMAKAIEQLKKEGLGNTFAAVGDISKEDDVVAMMKKAVDVTGRLDVLVNNACHLGVGYDFMSTTTEFWDEVMGVNARGCFLCSRYAAAEMMKLGGGTIINISSTCATRALRKRGAYCASKGAVDSLTKAMAVELATHNIRVNAIALGYVRTSRWETLPDGVAERRRLNVPLGREADYEDAGQLAMFLSSEKERIYRLNCGAEKSVGPFDLTAVKAIHSDPAAVGILIKIEGKTAYLSGDSLFDVKIAEEVKSKAAGKIDVMLICINGKLGNMSLDEAVEMVAFIKPVAACPMHYGLFAENTVDPQPFVEKCRRMKIKSMELQLGRRIEI